MFFPNLFVAARQALSDWRRREQAYDELMRLDDRSLADIGIRRSEIPAIVEGVHGSTRSSGFAGRPKIPAGAPRQAA
ncbi:MAG: DUF1127 domain-containing protein [Alphaproteobacteria bacterium]|nr:DUF1127 domain-containing protein [Alphaproteobacteria bacterium]